MKDKRKAEGVQSCPPKGNKSKNLTEVNKGQASKTKDYRGKKPTNNLSKDPQSYTNFKWQCIDLGEYIFDLGPRASDTFSQTMK